MLLSSIINTPLQRGELRRTKRLSNCFNSFPEDHERDKTVETVMPNAPVAAHPTEVGC